MTWEDWSQDLMSGLELCGGTAPDLVALMEDEEASTAVTAPEPGNPTKHRRLLYALLSRGLGGQQGRFWRRRGELVSEMGCSFGVGCASVSVDPKME